MGRIMGAETFFFMYKTTLKRSLSLLFLLLFMLIVFPACRLQTGNTIKEICFASQCFDIEVARTKEERMKGLQFRKSLPKDAGMLFIFPKSQPHSFWMKDTFLALDIIWIDQDKRIVEIMTNILPCKTEQCPVYTPSKDALYVLELNSGRSLESGLKVGDQASFR